MEKGDPPKIEGAIAISVISGRDRFVHALGGENLAREETSARGSKLELGGANLS